MSLHFRGSVVTQDWLTSLETQFTEDCHPVHGSLYLVPPVHGIKFLVESVVNCLRRLD